MLLYLHDSVVKLLNNNMHLNHGNVTRACIGTGTICDESTVCVIERGVATLNGLISGVSRVARVLAGNSIRVQYSEFPIKV